MGEGDGGGSRTERRAARAVAVALLLSAACSQSSPGTARDAGTHDAGRDGGSFVPGPVGLFVPEPGGPADEGGTPPADRFDPWATWIGAERPGTRAGEEWWAGWANFAADDPVPAPCEPVSSDITADTTWDGPCYALEGVVYVRNGALLTIDPGVTITGTESARSYLVVTTEGRIDARGTADAPIVLTSPRSPRERGPADVGGLVLLGLAPVNVTGGVDHIAGLPRTLGEGGFGGSDPEHDCGTLRHVRVEYGSFPIGAGQGLPALVVAGCGRSTELDHVMSTFADGDGIAVYGGSPRLRHLVVQSPRDDAVDVAFGFSGTLQHALFVLGRGDRAFEWDNNAGGRLNTPFTDPEIWNVTIVGAAVVDDGVDPGIAQEAMRLREGTRGRIHNVLMQDFAEDPCVEVNHAETKTHVDDGTLAIRDSLFVHCQTPLRFRVADTCSDAEPLCPSLGDPLTCPNGGPVERECELASGEPFTPPWLSDPDFGNTALDTRIVATPPPRSE